MTELEKMQRAKMYIDKMANGINPIEDAPVPESDALNNVRISRCLFYVSEILGQVIANNGVVGSSKVPKKEFAISNEALNNFAFSETPISVSEISRRLNALVDLNTYRKISYNDIASYLMEIGALEAITMVDGKTVKRPTERGNSLGISLEKRMGMNGEYVVVLYNKSAQQFILDNIEAIVSYSAALRQEKKEKKNAESAPAKDAAAYQ